MRTTMTSKARKFPPMDERADDMKHIIIASISHKLNRMDIEQFREVLNVATKIIERKK